MVDLLVVRKGAITTQVNDAIAAQKGVASGISPLDLDSKVPAANSRVESVAGKTQEVLLAGEDIASGTVPIARIGTGTKDITTFFRGDGIFAAPPVGSGGVATLDPLSAHGAVGLFTAMAYETTGTMNSATNSTRVTFASAATALNFAVGDPIVVEGASLDGMDLWTRVTAYTANDVFVTVADSALCTVTNARVLKPQTGTMTTSSNVVSGLADPAKYTVGGQVMVQYGGSTPRAEIQRIEVRGNSLRQLDIDTFQSATNKLTFFLDRTQYVITLALPTGQTTALTSQQIAQQIVDQVLVQQDVLAVNTGEWAGSVVLIPNVAGKYAAQFTSNTKTNVSQAKVLPNVTKNPFATLEGGSVTSGAVTAQTVFTPMTFQQGAGDNDIFGTVESINAVSGTITLTNIKSVNIDMGQSVTYDSLTNAYSSITAPKTVTNLTGSLREVTAAMKAMVLPDSTLAIKNTVAQSGSYFVNPVPGGFGINLIDGCFYREGVSLAGSGGKSKFTRIGSVPTPVEAQSPFLRNIEVGKGASNVTFLDFTIDGRRRPFNPELNIWEQESSALHIRSTAGSLYYCDNINIGDIRIINWPGPGLQIAQMRRSMISNLYINRCSRGGLVFFGDCDNVTITSPIVLDAGDDAFAANAARPITGGSTAPYAKRFRISNAHFRSKVPDQGEETNPAMSLRGARDFVVTNTFLENGFDASLTITPYFGSSARNMLFENLYLKNSFGAGFWFRGVDNRNIKIRGLTIEDCKGHGIWLDTYDGEGLVSQWQDIEITDVNIKRCGYDSVRALYLPGFDGIHVSGPCSFDGLSLTDIKGRNFSRSGIRFAQSGIAGSVQITNPRLHNGNEALETTARPSMMELANLSTFEVIGGMFLSAAGYPANKKTDYGLVVAASCSGGLVSGINAPASHHTTGSMNNLSTTTTLGTNRA